MAGSSIAVYRWWAGGKTGRAPSYDRIARRSMFQKNPWQAVEGERGGLGHAGIPQRRDAAQRARVSRLPGCPAPDGTGGRLGAGTVAGIARVEAGGGELAVEVGALLE